MLTTTDNPFDPFKLFDLWQRFDEDSGYHTMSYLARIAAVAPDLSDADNELAIEQAIDEIVELNLTGNYRKLVETDESQT